jgi:hypothetical protein
VWPYALLGESAWANYQLLCGNCNARKNAFVNTQIRKLLGGGEFRRMIVDYLRGAVQDDRLSLGIEPADLLRYGVAGQDERR